MPDVIEPRRRDTRIVCGRFAFYSPAEATAALFNVIADAEFAPRYNVAPTQDIAALRPGSAGGVELAELRWGLVPFWAKDPAIGNRMINARAETVAEKPAFRSAFRRRRCAILADGFYEWVRQDDSKQPYFIGRQDNQTMAFAGLWEEWTDKETGEHLQTATVVTTAANEFMHGLHQRMPVILTPENVTDWVASAESSPLDFAAQSPALAAWPVSRKVNSPANDEESLIEAVGDPYKPQGD